MRGIVLLALAVHASAFSQPALLGQVRGLRGLCNAQRMVMQADVPARDDMTRRGLLSTAVGLALGTLAPKSGLAAAGNTVVMHVKAFDGKKFDEGDLVFELWDDVAPQTVANFKNLVSSGFYDGTAFHRVSRFIKKGLIIGGDPNTKETSTCTDADKGKSCFQGNGYGPDNTISGPLKSSVDDIKKTRELWDKGGPEGWRRDSRSKFSLPLEVSDRPHEKGVITMRRFAKQDSAGSQFMICLSDMRAELDGQYAAFGKLIQGEELLDKIAKTETGSSGGAFEFYRDDGKAASVWSGYDRPTYRQGVETVRLQ